MSTRRFAIITMLFAALSVSTALAAELAGKIQTVDTAERTIVLDNGTKLWLSDGMSADDLKEGAEVTVAYDERDGKNVVTSMDLK
jgi:Cu/Ag efflux protein CusF